MDPSLTPAARALALHQHLRSQLAARVPVIRLPPGVHVLAGDLLPETWCDISNHDSGMKRTLLPITGAEDVVIDGSGCTLLAEDAFVPVRLQGCARVTLRHLTLDALRPGFSEVEVQAADSRGVELAAHPGLAADQGRLVALGAVGWPGDHLWCAVACDRARGEPLPGAAEHWHLERSHRAVALGGGRIRLEGAFGAGAPPVGSTLVLFHGDRVAPGVAIDQCRQVVLEDVTIHHAWGMGVVAQCSRDLTLRRVACVPAAGRMTSTWVDATHFVDCDGAIRLLDCTLTGMFDDGTNIHGAFRRVIGQPGPEQVLVRAEHPQQAGISNVRAGDRVRLHALADQALVHEAEVREVERLNRRVDRLVLATAVPAGLPPCALMRYAPSEVEVSGCTIAPLRGRALLFQIPGRIRVTGNRLHASGVGISVLSDTTYWWESGPVEDLLVMGNHFDACAYGPCGEDLLQILPESSSGRFAAPVVGRVAVIDNDIRRVRPSLVRAQAVAQLRVLGNRLSWHPAYPRLPGGPPVHLGPAVADAVVQPVP